MNSIEDIPVLFFPFARPEYARQTFDAIKKAQPKKFYFYCDKAREGHEEELKNNNIIREYINEVDWDCDIKTWFRDENIGVYQSIMDAIDWFFENEEMGIILEEDCVPSLAFFDFCRQLLPKYQDDKRVWFISGNNFLDKFDFKGYSYIFSAISYQWGWATWADRWHKIERYGFDVNKIIEEDVFYNIFGSRRIVKYANKDLIKKSYNNGIYRPKSWDYIFQMTVHINNGLAIIPEINLTKNIGVVGFNSKKLNKKFHNKILHKDDSFEVTKYPKYVISNMNYVHQFYANIVLDSKMFNKIKKALRKLKSFL